MKRIERLILNATVACICLLVSQGSAIAACTVLGGNYDGAGNQPWDNTAQDYFWFTQSGTALNGTLYTTCGSMNINTGRTHVIDGSGNVEFWFAAACQIGNPTNMLAANVKYTVSGWNTANCNEITLNWYVWDNPHNPATDPYDHNGYIVLRTYPESETSDVSVHGAPADWSEMAYIFKATAYSSYAGRKFPGRYFFEADNTPVDGDNCFVVGWPEALHYRHLNAGSPYPPIGNAGQLVADANGIGYWDDYVGETYGGLTFARQNSGIGNGSCSATVGQDVVMLTWDNPTDPDPLRRLYKTNAHVITAWNSEIPNYSPTSTTHWTGPASRDGNSHNKVWPILTPPNDVTFTSNTTSPSASVTLAWTAPATDEHDEYDIWRYASGGTGTHLVYSAQATGYTDTTPSGNTHYYYCVRSSRTTVAPYYGTTMHTPAACPPTDTHASTYPQPTSASASPSPTVLNRGTSDCFTATFGNGANMQIHIKYTLNGGAEIIDGAVYTLDGSGSVYLCSNPSSPTGTYTYTGIRNIQNTDSGVGPWVGVNVAITIQ